MNALTHFVKVTLIGGLLVVLPAWLTVLLLLKAVKGALGVLRPIAQLLPQSVVHEDLVALALLLAICFLAGLLARPRPVQRFGRWLEQSLFERVPGYTVLRGMTRQMAGKAEEQSFQPALHRRETRRREVHCVRLVQPDPDGGRDLHPPARTGAPRGGVLGHGDDVRHEVGRRLGRVACRDAFEMKTTPTKTQAGGRRLGSRPSAPFNSSR